MLKNRIVKSILSLISVGLVVKAISIIAKVITTRILQEEAMGLYMLVNPTMVLTINISQISLQTVIAKLLASKEDTQKVLVTSTILITIITIFFMILIIMFAPYFASTFLKNEKCVYALYGLALLLPLISIGTIIKGYYAGIGKIEITAYSQISEEIGRLAFIIAFGTTFLKISPAYGALAAIYSLCFGEVCSLTHMFIALKDNSRSYPKSFFKSLKEKTNYIFKKILGISIPLTSSRLIDSFTYFLEPIIMTSILLKKGLSVDQITIEYGMFTAYVLPLLLMPSFFSSSYGKVLLFEMSESEHQKNRKKSLKLFNNFSFLSLATGLIFSLLMFFFPSQLLLLLFKTKKGAKYVKMLTFPFLLYYLEAPLHAAMTSLNLEKNDFVVSLSSSIVRIIALVLLLPIYQVFAVMIASLIGIIVHIFMSLFYVYRRLIYDD